MRVLPFVFAASWSIALVSRTALATEDFPPAIESQLGLSYAPPCSLCHLGGVTGLGTVNTPFGRALRAGGLVAHDVGLLATLIEDARSSKTDSDGDGTSDIDELLAGTDPNVSDVPGMGTGAPDTTIGPPDYGCRTAPLGTHRELGKGSVLLLALAIALARRRSLGGTAPGQLGYRRVRAPRDGRG